MGTISPDLVSFKNSLGTSVDGMKSTSATLQSKIVDFSNACTTAQNGVDTYYNSDNKQTVLKKFTYVSDIFQKISTSLKSDLDTMLDEANQILTLIEELEDINTEISNQQSIVNNASASDKDKSSARSIIESKEITFVTKNSEALQKLNALKGKDAALSFLSEFTVSDYREKLAQLGFGTFEKTSFTATNNVTIEYYIYIPDYGEDVEGLPIHIYLHGGGETGTRVLNCGLPSMLKDKTITPSGIVICPQAKSDTECYTEAWQSALVELALSVADDKNADKDKISLSGHSYGAITGYQILERHPDVFSAFIPISGYSKNSYQDSEGLKDVKLWAFHGSGDPTCSYAKTKQIVEYLKSIGADASLYTYQGAGHCVQGYVFSKDHETEDGENVNPLEWAFQQSKSNA